MKAAECTSASSWAARLLSAGSSSLLPRFLTSLAGVLSSEGFTARPCRSHMSACSSHCFSEEHLPAPGISKIVQETGAKAGIGYPLNWHILYQAMIAKEARAPSSQACCVICVRRPCRL